MTVNWEVRRRHIAAWHALVVRCRAKIDDAQRDLGALSEGQCVDLLLDNFPELKDSGEARNAVRYAFNTNRR